MTSPSVPGGNGPPRGTRRFHDLLSMYKRRGCRILVTGDVDRSVVALQNRLLLGPEAADRDRTLAVTDVSDDRLSEYVPDASVSDGGTRLVRYRTIRNSTTAVVPPSAPTGPDPTSTSDLVFERERSPLIDLRAALVDVVAAYRERTAAPRPAGMRVGVATLRPLFDEYPRPAVRRFMQVVGDEVAGSRGFAHFLLPVSSSDALVDALLSSVDIHIRLRDQPDSRPEQSWQLVDHGETSGWLSLER